jgi:hypothetical protein
MNILITNIQMDTFSGTTFYVKELAETLKKKGHSVEIYTRTLGSIGNDIIQNGISVVTRIADLKYDPDIIHAHHNLTTFDSIFHFKQTPVIFWIHDRINFYDIPPYHENIIRYMSVDYNCKERYTKDFNFDSNDCGVIYNWVNMKRFKLRPKIAEKPRNALVFSNYASENNYLPKIREACSKLSLPLDVIGRTSGKDKSDPEFYLNNYDIIFAKAKASMEAIATGAGTIICDYRGLAGMVKSQNFWHYKKFNFGMKLMTKPITTDSLIEEIKKYSAKDIQVVADLLRQESRLDKTVDEILLLYVKCVRDFKRGTRGKHRFKVKNYLRIRSLEYYPKIVFYIKSKFPRYYKFLSKRKRKHYNLIKL